MHNGIDYILNHNQMALFMFSYISHAISEEEIEEKRIHERHLFSCILIG